MPPPVEPSPPPIGDGECIEPMPAAGAGFDPPARGLAFLAAFFALFFGALFFFATTRFFFFGAAFLAPVFIFFAFDFLFFAMIDLPIVQPYPVRLDDALVR